MLPTIKCYSELKKLKKFEDRLKYLRLNGKVSNRTFGSYRYLNQILYNSQEWKKVRREVILRDNGCDLSHEDYPLYNGNIYIHHINPIQIDDIEKKRDSLFDLENLVCTSRRTHEIIHYVSNENTISSMFPFCIERKKNDTCPWR